MRDEVQTPEVVVLPQGRVAGRRRRRPARVDDDGGQVGLVGQQSVDDAVNQPADPAVSGKTRREILESGDLSVG